jgi:hypothetical protein
MGQPIDFMEEILFIVGLRGPSKGVSVVHVLRATILRDIVEKAGTSPAGDIALHIFTHLIGVGFAFVVLISCTMTAGLL